MAATASASAGAPAQSTKIREKNECAICCDEYASKHMVQCINYKCAFSSCIKCYKTYLLDNSMQTKCMDCNVDFDHSILVKMFGRTFVMGQLRKAQKTILLERQLAQIPETQHSREFKYRQMTIKITAAYKELDAFFKQWKETPPKTDELYKSYDSKYKELRAKIDALIYERRTTMGVNNQEGVAESKPGVVMKCTHDDCRGFITSANYSCGICETVYCKKCLEVKNIDASADDIHECNQDSVETATFILKQSKPCPSCGTRISKVSGCDQMWCTQCHVTFSWKKGTVENGNVHNPHYFEWLRQNPNGNGEPVRNPGDVHCGGLLHINYLTSQFELVFGDCVKRNGLDIMIYYYRLIAHITEHTVPDLRESLARVENEAFMLEKRIDYLLGKITEEGLSRSATRRAYRIQRERKILQVYELVSIVGIEEVMKLRNNFLTVTGDARDERDRARSKMVQLFADKIDSIFEYFNENACVIENEFKCTVGKLDTYTQNKHMVAQNENNILISDDEDSD